MATLLQKLGIVAGIGLPVLVAGAAIGYEKKIESEIVVDGTEKFRVETDLISETVCHRGASRFFTQIDYFQVSSVWGVPVHSAFKYSIQEDFACDGRRPLGGSIIYADGTSQPFTKPGDPL